MVRRLGLTGLALLAALYACDGSVKGNDQDSKQDVIGDQYVQPDLTNDKPDVPNFDDNPYIPDEADNYVPDNPINDDVGTDDVSGDNPLDNGYDKLEDIVEDEGVLEYLEDTYPTDTNVDTVDPCAPVAKACGDDYRWKATDADLPDASYVGKCRPLEINVNFDGYFDICLDFGDSNEEDSGCYSSWQDGSSYKIPGHPTGSHANCGRKIVKWKYAFKKPECEIGAGVSTTEPYKNRTFSTNDSNVLCITAIDDSGKSSQEFLEFSVKQN